MSKTATVHAQQKWEYMEVTRKTEGYLVRELNELGQLGWEMVSILFHKDTKSGLGQALAWTAFLKRPFTGPVHAAGSTEKAAAAAPQASEKPKSQLQPSEKAAQEAEPDAASEIFDLQ